METKKAETALATAEKELARLRTAADDTEREAAQAKTAFESDPTDAHFMAQSVTAQRAKNARAAAERFENSNYAEAKMQLKQAERDAAKIKLLDAERATTDQLTKAFAALASAMSDLDLALVEAAKFDSLRKQLKAHGVDCKFDLPRVLMGYESKLREEFGRVPGGATTSPREPVDISDVSNATFLTIKITRGLVPLQVVRTHHVEDGPEAA